MTAYLESAILGALSREASARAVDMRVEALRTCRYVRTLITDDAWIEADCMRALGEQLMDAAWEVLP